MTHEENNDKSKDYKFLDYRLDQLEQNLRRGQEKLEETQSHNYQELLRILQTMQEKNDTQNQTLTELNTRLHTLEDMVPCIERVRESTVKQSEKIQNLERRLDIYKQVTIAIGLTAVGTFLTVLVNAIMKLK